MSERSTVAWAWLLPSSLLLAVTAAVSIVVIVLLKPVLVRYALARPSARGLHTIPTPQGGGIAVLLGCAACANAGAWWFGLGRGDWLRLEVVLAAAGGLAVLGLIDDIRPLPALPRLVAQLALMAVGLATLPEAARVLPFLPLTIERIVLVFAGAWFINLTNFMDGMDWITVADVAPVSAALTLFWLTGHVPTTEGLLALGLLGGLLGYAPFNKPPARLFLGDVGSLPIGFLVALCLFSLAGSDTAEMSFGPLAAAILLPLYPIADSGITLLWRLRHGERVWEPHRSHFYQVAVTRGRNVWGVLGRILAANMLLATFAFAAINGYSWMGTLGCGVAGVMVVAALLRALSASKTATPAR